MRTIAFAISLLALILAARPGGAQLPEPNNDAETGAIRRGALSGASVFVSPGHGWYHTSRGWVTQRGNSHGVVEDHSNAEAVIQYLLPYLENAGARVYMARERDMQTNMVIVEPGGAGYSERGDWQEIDVDGAYRGTMRYTRAINGEATARAVYTPDIPEDDYYAVYYWYRPHPRRTTADDARIVINHTGGSTVWQQDLNRDGYTWKYMGTYWFEAGSNDLRGSVVVPNQSQNAGDAIIAGAVRFGGGVGDLFVGRSELFPNLEEEAPPPSGKPRWEESGHTYALFMGFDPSLTTVRFNQVWAMPLWAQWEAEAWEKDISVYLSWHTNASIDGQIRGLSTYIYGEYAWGPHEDFSGFPGGVELANAVHDRLITVMREDWDPEWEDVGKVTRWLGEVNPIPNGKMPALLLENGFHDNPHDAAAILDPQFRDAGAKAVMQGLIDYYVDSVDGFDNRTYPPETPINPRITTNLRGEVTIAWDAPPFDADGTTTLGHRATGYRVYRSLNGRGFDNGFDVRETSFRARTIVPGEVAYYRVTATNSGGESKPTETLAVRLTVRDRPEILVVNGFDRLDRGLNIVLENGVERGILSRMNTFDYIIQHGTALDAWNEDFDSASSSAVAAGRVPLEDYKLVVWMFGRQSTADGTFDARKQDMIRIFIDGGGKVIVTGTDVATDLSTTTGGTQFLADVFGAHHAGRTGGNALLHPVADTPFAQMEPFGYDDGTGEVYLVADADTFEAVGGATPLLTQNGAIVAIAGENTILMSIPFEAINGTDAREGLMKAAINHLLGESPAEDLADSVAPSPAATDYSPYSTGGG